MRELMIMRNWMKILSNFHLYPFQSQKIALVSPKKQIYLQRRWKINNTK